MDARLFRARSSAHERIERAADARDPSEHCLNIRGSAGAERTGYLDGGARFTGRWPRYLGSFP
jgi:hypothetical protein